MVSQLEVSIIGHQPQTRVAKEGAKMHFFVDLACSHLVTPSVAVGVKPLLFIPCVSVYN